ncbi:MAG: glycosyltransferase 2 family protein [Pseudonocardiales bacterium]|jgi:serine/threonine-protein kinase RIO1/membrane-associated phospholipid phosphatase|nr:glycosyltransferase 2 family protein [Pseudonocardiales bacterium]
MATTRGTALRVDLIDHAVLDHIASLRTAWLTDVMRVLGAPATGWGVQIILFLNLIPLVFWRRWRHLIVWIGVGLVVDSVGFAAASLIQRPRPLGVEILADWKGYAMPSVPLAVLSAFLVSTAYANVPAGHARQVAKAVVASVLVLVSASRLYMAQDSPSDVLVGVVIGVAVSLVAFRVFASNDVFPVSYHRGRTAHLAIDESRLAAIVRAVEDQLCLIPIEVTPFGLEGSGGCTPLRIKVKSDGDHYVFGKLYAATHLRADRWYKLGRTLLYGRLEDEKAFNTVRRLVQYEDYLLRLLYATGLPVPRPYGIVELTPEREYLLVMEFFDGAKEIGDAEVDDGIIDQGLRVVRQMWEAGLAHRDIKPANLLVRNGQLLMIDSAFAQVRPSPWRQAVDLANMMLVLALRTNARQVYDRTRLYFDDLEIAEAFAATRGLSMPSQLRRMLRSQGHDLHAQFLALLPYQLPPVRIQRWSLRRVVLSVMVLAVGIVAILFAVQLLVRSPL